MDQTLLLIPVFLLLKLLPATSALDMGLWPLVTPILGGVSEDCKQASMEYIEALNQTLTGKVDPSKMWAIQMFDAGGTLPFMQEGMFSDTTTKEIDICAFLPPEMNSACQSLPESVRRLHVAIPVGYANAPGSEASCRKVNGILSSGEQMKGKYCHNYLVPYGLPHTPPDMKGHNAGWRDQSRMKLQEKVQAAVRSGSFNFGKKHTKAENVSTIKTDSSHLGNPFQNRFRTFFEFGNFIEQKVTDSIKSICDDCLEKDNKMNIINVLVGLYVTLWYGENSFSGMGYLAPGAYYGGCYPQSCSIEDIELNADAFALQFAVPGNPLIVTSSPRVPNFHIAAPDFFSPGIAKAMMEGSIECSDSDKYNGDWKGENYAIVVLYALIGCLIFIGTFVDAFDGYKMKGKQLIENAGHTSSTASSIIKSFSLLKNLEFIFGVSSGGSSERLGCLEGMRAISMTWVILGHNFLFGSMILQVTNKAEVNKIYTKEISLAAEAILQGEYSVDSFFFVGATLVSYLLLKDLDKTNGWFNKEGSVHMILFYVNRYLRITIPYALTLALFIGIMPLVITEPIGAASWAVQESEICKEWAWSHLLYVNNYYEEANFCIGHTWFLSTDMIFFFLSPLLIYPLWTSKFGLVQKTLSHVWWFLIVCSSVGLSYSYASDIDSWNKWIAENGLPTFDFAPWGWRNQCYIVGIMLGYILHVTKGKAIKIDTRLNILIWQIVFLVAFALIYAPHDPEVMDYISTKSMFFLTFHKLAWGLCLAWVTFSCCRGTGGLVNDFLSWDFFLPISKISFMTYLLHMDFNWHYFYMQDYNVDFSMWLLTEIFVAQVPICLFLGLISSLAFELPFSRVQKILIQLLVGKGKVAGK